MTILIGMDIQSIDEVEESIQEFGDLYVNRVFTIHEVRDCVDDEHATATMLADRFAAKEAVMKVLDFSEVPSPWKLIEIGVDGAGRDTVALRGGAAERAKRQGLRRLSVSLSHTDRLASAVVVAEFHLDERGEGGR